jgi:glycosyltransferase involved in cell wall biosynthesis
MNRLNSIKAVYESLCNQSYYNIEWIIIDNGDDGTFNYIKSIKKSAPFPIIYRQQITQGLHLSYNEAADIANGEFYFPLHSDDLVISDTFQNIETAWRNIPEAARERFCGITGTCLNENLKRFAPNLPSKKFDKRHDELRYKDGYWWQLAGCYRLNIIKEFPFPDIGAGVRYIPESLVWNRISKKYLTRFINDPIKIYTLPGDRKDSLSNIKNPEEVAIQHRFFFKECLNSDYEWIFSNPKVFYKIASNYLFYSSLKSIPLSESLNELSNMRLRVLSLLAIPGLIFLKWRHKNED